MERFGYDMYEADIEKAMGSVYYLLCERVESDFGLFREPLPPAPDRCDYKDFEAHSKAVRAWQDGLCKLRRWTRVEQLDQYLLSPIEPESQGRR